MKAAASAFALLLLGLLPCPAARPATRAAQQSTYIPNSGTAPTAAAEKPDASAAAIYVAEKCNGGAACADTNDGLSWGTAKATVSAAISALQAEGGGTIELGGGTFTLSPDTTFPEEGSSEHQYPIRIIGRGADQITQGGGFGTSVTTLSFTAAATNADLVTLYYGVLDIENVSFTTTTCSPFILTTATTLRLLDDQFTGSAAAPSSCNDAIVLGGTTASDTTGNAADAFQGYGTVIEGNSFHEIRRAVLAQTYAAGIWIEQNDYAQNSGNTGYCAFADDDPNNAGSNSIQISGNRIELNNVKCAAAFTNANAAVFTNNDLEDFSTANNTSIVSLTNSDNALIIAGTYAPPSAIPFVSADANSQGFTYIAPWPQYSYSSFSDFGGIQLFSGMTNGGLYINDASSFAPNALPPAGADFANLTLHGSANPGFTWNYTPSGSSNYELFGLSDNSATVEHLQIGGSSDGFLNGMNNADLFVQSQGSGNLHLGNSTDSSAIQIVGGNTFFEQPVWNQTGSTTLTGVTAGTAIWVMPQQGSAQKVFYVYLSGYENTTATAQTITFPNGFASFNGVVTISGSCAGVSASLTELTLPASMSGAQTGGCKVEGF